MTGKNLLGVGFTVVGINSFCKKVNKRVSYLKHYVFMYMISCSTKGFEL